MLRLLVVVEALAFPLPGAPRRRRSFVPDLGLVLGLGRCTPDGRAVLVELVVPGVAGAPHRRALARRGLRGRGETTGEAAPEAPPRRGPRGSHGRGPRGGTPA